MSWSEPIKKSWITIFREMSTHISCDVSGPRDVSGHMPSVMSYNVIWVKLKNLHIPVKWVGKLKETNRKPSQDVLNLFLDLSSARSTVSMFQYLDLSLMCELREYCQGTKNLICRYAAVEFQQRVRKRYPVMLDRFIAFSEESGFLPQHWGAFFTLLIDHVLEFFTSLTHRNPKSEY